MPRFVSNHNTTALTKFVLPSGRTLTFDRGVLDTDDEGAAVIRKDPLFGRTIFDGDPTVPAHGEIPQAVPAEDTVKIAATMTNMRYCDICEQTFVSEVNYRRHMHKTHGEEGGEAHG